MPTHHRRAAGALTALALLLPAAARAPSPGRDPLPDAPAAEAPAGFRFGVAEIMRGPELAGRPPADVRWAPDGRWIHFDWAEPGTDWREPLRPYRVRAEAGARPERLSDAAMDTLGPRVASGALAPDRTWKAVSYAGDLFLVALPDGELRRLTRTAAREHDPTISSDGREIYFLRDDQAFAIERGTGLVRQLADIQPGPAPEDSTAEGQRGFLAAEQRRLLGAVRDRVAADSVAEAERRERSRRQVPPAWLGGDKAEEVLDLAVAPSGRWILVTAGRESDDRRETGVPEYVTTSGYTGELEARAKVGDAQDRSRLGLLRVGADSVRWLEVMPGDTLGESDLRVLGWNRRGSAALVSAASRDYKTHRLVVVDTSGAISAVETLRDSAWTGGPCYRCGGWIGERDRVWFVSETDGWAHLYTADADGGDRRQLTSGAWEVRAVEVSPDGRHFHLHASVESPYEIHFHRLPVDGGRLERLTSGAGAHEVVVSPDGRRLADVHSAANLPPELHVAPARPGARPVRLTTSPAPAFSAGPWIAPEIVTIPASDGARVPARIYRPADLGAAPNGAAVIFVHGAGYLQNAHRWWSTYYREYMFHHLLASRDYVVLDLDYRGSAGHGRDWRTAVYRHMGGRDLQDHVDASRWLRDSLGIPPERVGIYGGSYGGFITLMALFTESEWFGAGAALRAVTDWAHYNHWYTSRILNLPQADSTAYRRSSPIYFAEGLEDPLLIAHGMADVNVHFQDVVRLAQRLIELGKTDWELAVYPVEDHAFERPDSWADEYRRILELFERTIGRPREAADGRTIGGP